MKLSNINLSSCSALFVLAYMASAAPVETAVSNTLQIRESSAAELNLENIQILADRSNLPILDKILEALKNTGIANVVIEFVLLDNTLRQITTDITIRLLESNQIDFTSLLVGLEKSGLVILFLNLALDDLEITVGLLRITKDLLRQFGLNLKRDVETLDERSTEVAVSISDQDTDFLTDILTSLNDSGLAMSVIQGLLTNPALSEPSAIFLADIIKSGAIPLKELLVAVKDSNIVFLLLRDILRDRDLLTKFGGIIKLRIQRGLISQDLYDSL